MVWVASSLCLIDTNIPSSLQLLDRMRQLQIVGITDKLAFEQGN